MRAAAGQPHPLTLAERLRLAGRAAAIVTIIVPCIALHYCWRIVARPSPWPRRFLRWTGWICGARVTRHGTPVRSGVVFLSNHVSWIDILVIAGTSGSAFVAKAEIRAALVVGWLSTLNRTIFVDRDDRTGIARQIERLRAAVADRAVTLFPAGTTDDGRSLLPFKSALLKVLEPPPAGVVVQPLLLDYGAVGAEIGWLGQERGAGNAARVLGRRGGFAVGVHYLQPFEPVRFAGRKAIAAEARRAIADALSAITGAPTPDFVGHAAWASGAVAQSGGPTYPATSAADRVEGGDA